MTKKLSFNSDTTYIFNHPHFYKELAGKKCKVVNWNPPNLYTIEYEDGARITETENYLQECLSEFQNFSVGDIVYFCKPDSPHYKQKAKVIQTSPKLCVRLFSQPFDFVPIEVEPHDIREFSLFDADTPPPTEEPTTSSTNLILKEGLIVKVWDTNRKLVYDANDTIIASLKRQAESILVKIKELETAKVL